MLRFLFLVVLFGTALPLAASDFRVTERAPGGKMVLGTYREILWDDLIPKGWDPMRAFRGIDLNSLSDSDPRAAELLARVRAEWDKAPVEPAMHGKKVRIAGFVIPLERQGELVREFLLVPFFGACIHVPPPPANQVIHVVAGKPVKGMRTMDTYWVNGTLSLQSGDSGMGVYGYRIAGDRAEPYEFKQGKRR